MMKSGNQPPLKGNRFLLVFLFYTFTGLLYAQPPLDSLLRRVQYQKEDTLKVNLYYDIGMRYAQRDKNLLKAYTDSVKRLSQKLNYSRGLGMAYSGYGYYYFFEKEWSKLKFNLQKSDSIYEKIGEKGKLISNKGIMTLYYNYTKEHDKELQLCLEILEYREKNDSKAEVAKVLGRIAGIFYQLQRYKEAKIYFLRSIRIRDEIKDFAGKSISLLNLGGMLAQQDRFREAEPYLIEAMRLQELFKQETTIMFCMSNLAHVYVETGRERKGLEMAAKCEAFLGKQKDTLNLVKIGYYQAVGYTKLKQFDKALAVLNERYKLVKGNPIYKVQEANLLWEYYKVYKAMGKTDVALGYFEEANVLREQNDKAEVQHGVSRLKVQFETKRKQEENEQLKRDNELKDLQISQRNYLIYGSILMLLLISIIAFTTIRNNRLKARNKEVEMEQRLLQSQMNPHFIFNVLHAIHTYMLKKDTEESGNLLTSFARLVRSILQHSSTDNISLTDELNWLKDYIRLQQLRFNDSFQFTIEVDEQLSPDNVLLPPMLIQPFVENAIEHGFSGLDKPGELHVSYKKSGKEVEIRIADNGKGFSKSDLVRGKKEHESVAIQITEKRINLLNKKRKRAFKFEITSQPNEGTTVFFSIPYQTLFD